MFVVSKEIYKINRRRKREYTPNEVSKEVVKEYQKKKLKPMNYERRYYNYIKLKNNEDIEVEFRRRIENTINNKNKDKMNEDR